MAKQGKTLPARRPREMESSLFLRSAESLGRVIGTLQRQLDTASKRLIHDVDDTTPANNDQRPRKTKKTKAAKATKKTAKKTKTTRAAANKTKKPGANKTTRR